MTSATATTTVPEIKQDVLDLSKKYQSVLDITIDPNNPAQGLAILKQEEGKSVFIDNMPEGLDEATYRKSQNYDSLSIAAVGHAFGHESIDFLKKNKAVESVNLHVPTVGKDSFKGDLQRVKTIPMPGSKTGETITQHAAFKLVHEVHGTRNIGEMKKVKLEIANAGAKHLASK